MKGNKVSNKISGNLGVFSEGQKIFLFHSCSNDKKDFFQVDKSPDGFCFSPHSSKGEILKENGEREKIETCQDFKVSKLKDKYFLTYRFKVGKKTFLCSALSDDLVHWKKLGKILELDQEGILIPSYEDKGKYALYLVGKSIKIVFSENLKTWEVSQKLISKLPKELKEEYSIKAGSLVEDEKGLLLIYSLFREKGQPGDCSVRALLFDKKNPQKLLWESDRIIWKQTSEWINQQISPLGTAVSGDHLISYWQIEDGELFALSHPYFKSILKRSRSSFSFPILKRFRQNPILKPVANRSWESKFVFNPAAIYEDGKVHLVYRAVGENDVSVLAYASSKDGICIDERLKKPIYAPVQSFGSNFQTPKVRFASYMSGGGGYGGCEDPRLTRIKNKIYMTYVAFNGRELPRVALTSIRLDDFLSKKQKWEPSVLISPPGEINKNWVIFPEKINGKYAILHSISPEVLIDYVDSLKFDGNTFIKSYHSGILREDCWDSWVRGVGPPPIKTKDGWLVLYHAMDKEDPNRYKVGAMILDYKNPAKILYRSSQPILEPDASYENEGFKGGVVYVCGAVVVNNRLLVYYGGADTVICAAAVNLNKFLDQLKYSGSAKLKTIEKN